MVRQAHHERELDGLTTNGTCLPTFTLSPFALSPSTVLRTGLSKGERAALRSVHGSLRQGRV
jgi:hypothetical protein